MESLNQIIKAVQDKRQNAAISIGPFFVLNSEDTGSSTLQDTKNSSFFNLNFVDKLTESREIDPRAGLVLRIIDFLSLDPPDKPSRALVRERWDNARCLYLDAINLLYPYNLSHAPQVSIFENSFDLKYEAISTNEEFLALETELAELVEGEDISFDFEDAIKKIILKILAALGLKFDKADLTNLLKFVGEAIGKLFDDLLNHLKNERYAKAWKAFWAILDSLVSDKFSQKMAKALGKGAAERFLTALGGKLLPIIGWAIFIGALIWEFVAQLFD